MKKNELVHLHALLARVATDYRERGLVSDADLDPYRDVGVGPSSLTQSRAEHHRAIRTLLSILADHSDPDVASESKFDPESPPDPGPPTGNH